MNVPQIISFYFRLENKKNLMLKLIKTLMVRGLSLSEIDERIANYLNICGTSLNINCIEDIIISCYKFSLYLVIHFFLVQKIYVRYTEKMYHSNYLYQFSKIISHAVQVLPEFKVCPNIIIYLDKYDVKPLLNEHLFEITELKKWHNDNYWYWYNINILTKYIKKYSWENSIRCCWINACIRI